MWISYFCQAQQLSILLIFGINQLMNKHRRWDASCVCLLVTTHHGNIHQITGAWALHVAVYFVTIHLRECMEELPRLRQENSPSRFTPHQATNSQSVMCPNHTKTLQTPASGFSESKIENTQLHHNALEAIKYQDEKFHPGLKKALF